MKDVIFYTVLLFVVYTAGITVLTDIPSDKPEITPETRYVVIRSGTWPDHIEFLEERNVSKTMIPFYRAVWTKDLEKAEKFGEKWSAQDAACILGGIAISMGSLP